jgi:hypothetical protein
VPNLIIVVVGDTFSGKSHYIAALIHQIKADWMANTSGYARFLCVTPDREKDYVQGFNRLFGLHQPIPLTPRTPSSSPNQRPLIYNLVVSATPNHPPISVNLMIYDASGEDFKDIYTLVQVARFTLNANALIFTVDPCTITPLIQQLPAQLKLDLQQQITGARGRRAADTLSSVIEIVERYRGVPAGSSFHDTPVAIMLSKSDILQPANLPYTSMHRDDDYGDHIDFQEIDAIDEEVKDLLRRYGQGDLLAATHRFRRLKFFATSATGVPPDASGSFPSVEPRHCLDPILWILHQLKIL